MRRGSIEEMRKKVRELPDNYIQELKAGHPDITVELLDEQTPWVDARLRIECTSLDQFDEGVYITASAYHPASMIFPEDEPE